MRASIPPAHSGASIDVMGLGLENLPPTVVEQTIEALPRDNFKRVFVDALFSRVQKDPTRLGGADVDERCRAKTYPWVRVPRLRRPCLGRQLCRVKTSG